MMKRGGRSDQAVTQVKGLSSVKLEIMEADLFRNEGRQHDAHRQGERGVAPSESMTTAWEQKRDGRDLGVPNPASWANNLKKEGNPGLRESDQLIVEGKAGQLPLSPRGRSKGLASVRKAKGKR